MAKRKTKKKNDWEAIERDYITSNLTYRELARNYKVSESRLNVVGAKRKWKIKRKEYREGVMEETIAERKRTAVYEKAEFDSKTERVCDIAASLIASKLTTLHNESQEARGKELSTETVMEGLVAMKAAQDIKYRVLGVPPPRSLSSIDEEKAHNYFLERLAEARARLEAEGKVIKRSKDNGRPLLKPNDFIEIEILEPAPRASKN